MFWQRQSPTKWAPFAAVVVLPVALMLAPCAGADPSGIEQPGVVHAVHAPGAAPGPEAPSAVELAEIADLAAAIPAEGPTVRPAAHVGVSPRLLPPGVCQEDGLQVKTILVERAVSAAFPRIRDMIGVRPDAKPWHPSGRAVDIMIPDAGSSEGIALGDAILDFAMRNAERFAVQDVIWRGTYYTPGNGPSGSGYGHYDHVHITTFGGGYPSGAEEYFSD